MAVVWRVRRRVVGKFRVVEECGSHTQGGRPHDSPRGANVIITLSYALTAFPEVDPKT